MRAKFGADNVQTRQEAPFLRQGSTCLISLRHHRLPRRQRGPQILPFRLRPLLLHTIRPPRSRLLWRSVGRPPTRPCPHRPLLWLRDSTAPARRIRSLAASRSPRRTTSKSTPRSRASLPRTIGRARSSSPPIRRRRSWLRLRGPSPRRLRLHPTRRGPHRSRRPLTQPAGPGSRRAGQALRRRQLSRHHLRRRRPLPHPHRICSPHRRRRRPIPRPLPRLRCLLRAQPRPPTQRRATTPRSRCMRPSPIRAPLWPRVSTHNQR